MNDKESTDWPAFAGDMLSGDPDRIKRHLPDWMLETEMKTEERIVIDVVVRNAGVLSVVVNGRQPVQLSSFQADSLSIDGVIELNTAYAGDVELVAPRGSVSVSGHPDPYAFMSRDQAVRQLKWERRRADRLRAKVKRLKRQRDKARRRAR
jgi:hypothetical protein